MRPPASTGAVAEGSRRPWPSRRLALGLSPTPQPALVVLLLGTAFGPHGLGVLTGGILTSLDPVISVALVALGAMAGLGIDLRQPREAHILAAASLEAGVTILVVSMASFLLLPLSSISESIPWLLALMLGVCAAPSATSGERSLDANDAMATRIGDLDDVLPILLSVATVAWTRQGSAGAVVALVLQGGLIALALAFAARLLMTRASSESERRVFLLGALLLLGGVAAHLALSALFAGLLAGVLWGTRSAAREAVSTDLQYLQHPLVVLLLIVAGARLTLPAHLGGLVGAFVVVRILGKRVGGWMAGRAAPDIPRDLGFSLSAPGVVAIAIALNVLQVQGSPATPSALFPVVIAGTLGSEALSLLARRREHDA